MQDRSRRVALLIDYDNLQICAARDTPGRDLQLEPVMHFAQKQGTIMAARAYAEWNLPTERLAVYKAGIEPSFAPVLRTENDRSGKSLADTVMVAEGMDILWTLMPDVIVLATSDKDLIPLVRVAKQRGARVVVIGSDLTAIPLREIADEHVTYKQLVNEAQTRYAETPGKAQPEPVRRARGVDREGREGGRTREPREPRVTGPVAAAAPLALASPISSGTPVAPATLGADGEPTGTGRRRRRRRSTRRGDRIGSDGMVMENGDEGYEGSDSEFEGAPENGAVIPPLPVVDEAEEEENEVVEAIELLPGEPDTTSLANGVAAEPPPARRRRTSRRTGSSSAAVAAPEAEAEGAPAAEAAAPAPVRRRRSTRTSTAATSVADPEIAPETNA